MSEQEKNIARVLAHGFDLIRHGQSESERRLGRSMHAVAVLAELYLSIPADVRRDNLE
jgi:hypothetical protein